MHRQYIIRTLGRYEELWTKSPDLGLTSAEIVQEQSRISQITTFVQEHQDCFDRSCLLGHITGSALVVSKDLGAVLLTLHRKLDAWLQLGGHSDGDPCTHQVAMREAQEESGLMGLEFLPFERTIPEHTTDEPLPPLPFDLDCHLIPARKSEPEHIHYDIRYLIVADQNQPLIISDESHDLRWFSLAEAKALTSEASMRRQFAKLEQLRGRFFSPN
jgi:8-oxo-dGTP pyrophosphatase MutT (NUDIX family)